jgi:hypothetical protein
VCARNKDSKGVDLHGSDTAASSQHVQADSFTEQELSSFSSDNCHLGLTVVGENMTFRVKPFDTIGEESIDE